MLIIPASIFKKKMEGKIIKKPFLANDGSDWNMSSVAAKGATSLASRQWAVRVTGS
jgi:hypothetical protein